MVPDRLGAVAIGQAVPDEWLREVQGSHGAVVRFQASIHDVINTRLDYRAPSEENP